MKKKLVVLPRVELSTLKNKGTRSSTPILMTRHMQESVFNKQKQSFSPFSKKGSSPQKRSKIALKLRRNMPPELLVKSRTNMSQRTNFETINSPANPLTKRDIMEKGENRLLTVVGPDKSCILRSEGLENKHEVWTRYNYM